MVLERLEDAVVQNDNVLAVLAGSRRNHSGNSTSITTSDASAQERLFRNIMQSARVFLDDIPNYRLPAWPLCWRCIIMFQVNQPLGAKMLSWDNIAILIPSLVEHNGIMRLEYLGYLKVY